MSPVNYHPAADAHPALLLLDNLVNNSSRRHSYKRGIGTRPSAVFVVAPHQPLMTAPTPLGLAAALCRRALAAHTAPALRMAAPAAAMAGMRVGEGAGEGARRQAGQGGRRRCMHESMLPLLPLPVPVPRCHVQLRAPSTRWGREMEGGGG